MENSPQLSYEEKSVLFGPKPLWFRITKSGVIFPYYNKTSVMLVLSSVKIIYQDRNFLIGGATLPPSWFREKLLYN